MYLGRVVEQGMAVDVIERPEASVHAGPRHGDPGALGGRRRRARAAKGELPDATAVPSGCRFHPRCPRRFEPCDRVDPQVPQARRTRSRRACSTTRRGVGTAPPPPMGDRWRGVAGPVGRLEPGPLNTVADVPGVLVGHAQAASGERTGVTVVAPPSLPAAAGAATVNGMGELTGMLEVQERGSIITPVYLCGTHAVGTVHRAATLAAGAGQGNVVLPTVGECDDSDMGDSLTVTGTTSTVRSTIWTPRCPRAAWARARG